MLSKENLTEQKVSDIVTMNYNTAGVFREHGIDFCCGGGITLKEACEKNGADLTRVTHELEQMTSSGAATSDNYHEWSPDFLIDYIKEIHHRFVRTKTEEIAAYAWKVARVHGDRHPWNVTVYHRFKKLADDMLVHLNDEEKTVFPLIFKVYELRENGLEVDSETAGSLRRELDRMRGDHDGAGTIMAEISDLTCGFVPPPDACTTYRILYQNLAGFEQDLHKHVHLENNILFPKAEELLD